MQHISADLALRPVYQLLDPRLERVYRPRPPRASGHGSTAGRWSRQTIIGRSASAACWHGGALVAFCAMSEWLAALIVGIPALVVSVVALVYAQRSAAHSAASASEAKRSADAAEEVARLERERRHEERKPLIVPAFYRRGEKSGHPELRLTHEGGTNCDVVEVTLQAAGSYPAVITGFSHTRPPWVIAPFRDGEQHGITTMDPAEDGGRVIVQCVCRNAEEAWDLRLPLDVPADPAVQVW